MKRINRSVANNAASARQSLTDANLPLDPELAVVHPSKNSTQGTGLVSYDSLSEEEKRRIVLKRMLINAEDKGVGPLGQVHVEDKDYQFIDAQIKEQEAAHFDQWVSRHIDWSNPASIAVWRQTCPGFFERRMKYLEGVVDQQTKLAMIEARGSPASEEEARLLYMVDTGQVKIHKEGAHILVSKPPQGQDKAAIQRGWISNLAKPSVMDRSGDRLIQRLRRPFDQVPLSNADNADISILGGTGLNFNAKAEEL